MTETNRLSKAIVMSMILLGASIGIYLPQAANAATTIAPTSITEDIKVGEELAQNITVTLDAQEVNVDVYFIVDLSGSFLDDIATFKTQASSIMTDISAAIPNAQFGVGSFVDYPISPFGIPGIDYAYQREIAITDDTTAVLNTINALTLFNGDDFPESQLPALYQTATGAGQDTNGDSDFADQEDIAPDQDAGFRADSVRIAILWTDANFHAPPGYPGPSFADTIAALNAENVKVIGLSAGGGGFANLAQIASGTETLAPTGGVDCDANGTTDVAEGDPVVCTISASGAGVADAVVATVQAVALEGDLSLVAVDNPATAFDETDLVLSITPAVFEDIDLEEGGEFTFDLVKTCTEDAAEGPNSFTFEARLDGSVIGTVPITINCIFNEEPDCSNAVPSTESLWPPNHKMQEITIEGVTDADGDSVSITVTSIFQDEPTNGLGDGDQSPDGAGIGTDTAEVRAERSGTGDGRVYIISFTADDGNGGMCSSTVQVGVPHDKGGDSFIGQGPLFDSTLG